jgi:hypothetical protein
MTYNPATPQVNDDPTVSQAQLLANFGVLNTDFNVNHIPFTQSFNPGLHTQINFPVPLILDPDLASPQSSVYPKNSPQTNTNELFFQNNSTLAAVRQLTNLPIVNGVITGIAISGSTITITTSNTNRLSNTDSVTFFSILGSTQLNGNTYTVSNVTANSFQVTQADVSPYLGSGFYTTTSAIAGTNYGFLSPWGFIFNLGLTQIPMVISFAYPFPPGFTIYFAGMTSSSGQPNISNITATGATWGGTAALTSYYLVIGK